jgi:mannose-6-phosphate isomerase-like protein (cupin superfamily)
MSGNEPSARIETADANGSGAGPTAPTARRVEKPWGHELIWVVTDRYVGKVIHIDQGRRLSLQYHRQKDESVFVIRGRLRLHLENQSGEMGFRDLAEGEFERVPVGRRHRFEALEDVDVIEVSTPELDDVVRVEDDYGREGTSAP